MIKQLCEQFEQNSTVINTVCYIDEFLRSSEKTKQNICSCYKTSVGYCILRLLLELL